MGKAAKFLLALLVVISVLLPAVALRVRGVISDREEAAAGLEADLGQMSQELSEAEDALGKAGEELSRSKDELEGAKRDLRTAATNVTRLQREVRSEKQQREKAEADLKARTAELSSVGEEIKRKDAEIKALKAKAPATDGQLETLRKTIDEQKKEIERLRRIAGDAAPEAIEAPLAEGKVIAVGGGVFTASFSGNLGIEPGTGIYVSRREEIVEKIELKQLYETNVVFEFSEQNVDEVRRGDSVVIEKGRGFFEPENFQGRISRLRRHGFATVELSKASFAPEFPEVLVYRKGKLIFSAVPERILNAVTVAEFQVDSDARILRSDTIRVEKQ